MSGLAATNLESSTKSYSMYERITSRGNPTQFTVDTLGNFDKKAITQEELSKVDSVANSMYMAPIDRIFKDDRLIIVMDWTPIAIYHHSIAMDRTAIAMFRTPTKFKEVALYTTPITKQTSIETEDGELHPDPRYLLVSKQLEVLIVARGESTNDSPPQELQRKLFWDQEKRPLNFDKLTMNFHHGQIELTIPHMESSGQNDSDLVSALSALTMKEQTSVKLPATTIEVKCDVGYGNNLSIVGTGPGMNWSQGIPLTNIGSDRWICEISSDKFKEFEFKILRNGKDFEQGSNHTIECGKTAVIAPTF